MKEELKAVFEKNDLEYQHVSKLTALLLFLGNKESNSKLKKKTNFMNFKKTSSPPPLKSYRLKPWWKNKTGRVEEIKVQKTKYVETNRVFRHFCPIKIRKHRKKEKLSKSNIPTQVKSFRMRFYGGNQVSSLDTRQIPYYFLAFLHYYDSNTNNRIDSFQLWNPSKSCSFLIATWAEEIKPVMREKVEIENTKKKEISAFWNIRTIRILMQGTKTLMFQLKT